MSLTNHAKMYLGSRFVTREILLELCAWIGSPEGSTDDLGKSGDFHRGGWSFAFRIADALELHGPDKGKNEYLGVDKIIWRSEKVLDGQ